MQHGIGYPKFYIYDTAGSALISIPSNLGTSGCISLTSKQTVLNEPKPERVDVEYNDMPFTKEDMREHDGYKYRATLTVKIGDYTSGLLQYAADQANPTKCNDLTKLRAIEAYANAGYWIKFTPHSDVEDLWNCPYPIWVDVKVRDMGKINRIYSDFMTVDIKSVGLIASHYPFYPFSFTHLDGIPNTTQCVSLNGTTQYFSCTEFSLGTTHSIEFWTKNSVFDGANIIVSGATGGASYIVVDTTSINYRVQAGTVKSATHSAVEADLNHWVITRSGATLTFYLNGVSLGTATLTGGDGVKDFYINEVGRGETIYFYQGKLRALRGYTSVITPAQVTRQYNSGYGNWPLDIALLFVYEFDGTGGTQTPITSEKEDNQETTANRDLTGQNSPTRTTL